ncbi:MAG: cation:proton antiporter [Bdellovibrionales bacterium]|nr:cation:proton antiporter [Bdellovibrionales bacterium]
MSFWSHVLDIVLLLFGCVAAGGIASRLGQSPIVGYLLAGMLLGGPAGFYLIGSQGEIELIAELGVSLLLFSLGLEFSWERLKAMGPAALLSGALQVTLTLLVFALSFWLLGFNASEAVALGATLSVSSTACVLRVLGDRAELDSAHGRHAITILLVQDIAIVPLALLITFLGTKGSVSEIVYSFLNTIALISALAIGLFVFINYIAVKLLGSFTIERNRELSILFGTAIGLGSTWLAHEFKLSPALGAFLAGMFLGSSPFATQVRADITSMKIILLTLFFGAAGMVANPLWILENILLVSGTTLLVICGKALIISLILAGIKRPPSMSLATGLTVSQVGEFAFVLGALAQQLEVIDSETYLLIVSTAIVSLFITPYLISYAPRIGMWFGELFGGGVIDSKAKGEDHPHPEIVIIGFGPAGESAAGAFCEYGKKLLIIDLNKLAKKKALEAGYSVLIGDAALYDVMEHADITATKLFIITIPHHDSVVKSIAHIRKLSPDARTVVRARHQVEVEPLRQAGADIVIGDEEEVGHVLALQARHLISGSILELK